MIKIEARGKYGGVKIHLDAEECEQLMEVQPIEMPPGVKILPAGVALLLACKMGKKIREKLEEDPGLLQDRTPEQVAAILAKEVEKASMQLAQVKQGSGWQKVDQSKLKEALLKHVEE